MDPLVSVIIPCFNAEKYLPEAVNSVLSQTFTDLECIIVDDGSTDNTRQISKTLVQKDARVKYLFKKKGGVSSARNLGIENANGQWIQLLDSDDLLHEDKIRFQLNALELSKIQSQVVLYSDYEVFWEDDSRKVIKREYIEVGRLTKKQLLERLMNGGFKANLPLHSNNMLFEKGIFERKRFNESLMAYEDMEVWVDLLINEDILFIYTPICGMYYRIHHSNVTKDHSLIRHSYIDFIKEVHKKNKNLLKLTPHVERLTFLGIKNEDHELVDRLIKLIDMTGLPICFKGIFNVSPLLIKLHRFKLLFPMVTLWNHLKYLKNKIARFLFPDSVKLR